MKKTLLPLFGIVLLLGGGWLVKSGTFTGKQGAGPSVPVASASAAPAQRRRFPAARVVVAEAVEKMLSPAAEAPGTIISVGDSLIAAETTGKITWVAEVGDIIEKDGVIAEIDAAPATLTLRESRSNVARLKARYDFLQDRYQRFSELGDDIGESETSLLGMRSERDEALEQLNNAKIAVERADFILSRTKVRAPFAGRIAARQIQVGEYANPGTQIARLVDTEQLEVRAQTSPALVSSLAVGAPVSVINGVDTIIGRVRAIVPVGDAVSRTLELRVSLPPETGWYVGAAVRVVVPSAEPRLAIAAPRDSLHFRTNEISVYKINDSQKDQQTATKIAVELGIAEGDLIEILGDVAPGDRLVIRGGERLRDGQSVEVIPATSQNRSSAA